MYAIQVSILAHVCVALLSPSALAYWTNSKVAPRSVLSRSFAHQKLEVIWEVNYEVLLVGMSLAKLVKPR